MLRRVGLFLGVAVFCASLANAQALEEIPIERCDRLLVAKVKVDTKEMRFLVDSGATSILNIKSFGGSTGGSIRIHSWTGEAATSAREVTIPTLSIGSHQVHNLKLAAIDLSPIGKACGGQIDGLLGVDLMEALGLRIDFERKLLTFSPRPDDLKRAFDEMETSMAPCKAAFETANAKAFEECLDPDIIFYTPQGEYKGRKEVLQYLHDRYFRYGTKMMYDAVVRDARLFGDALWYSYDYVIDTPREHVAGRGMSMCRKNDGRWRILNMHHSRREPDAASAAKPVPSSSPQ